MSDTEKDPIMEQLIESMELQAAFNTGDGEPPYAYQNVKSGGKVKWVCSYDEKDRLTSVFVFPKECDPPRTIDYVDEAKARMIRDTLLDDGDWAPIDPPKISLSYGKHKGVDKPIKARKVKRHLDRESKKFEKQTTKK